MGFKGGTVFSDQHIWWYVKLQQKGKNSHELTPCRRMWSEEKEGIENGEISDNSEYQSNSKANT
jgi:hypothetical protein